MFPGSVTPSPSPAESSTQRAVNAGASAAVRPAGFESIPDIGTSAWSSGSDSEEDADGPGSAVKTKGEIWREKHSEGYDRDAVREEVVELTNATGKRGR